VAIITGANHGIGAATARRLASSGARVLVSFLRIQDVPDPGIPQRYRENRASSADDVVAEIVEGGGEAFAVEADLRDSNTAVHLFDIAEAKLGPVDILVNNASGWLADTFIAEPQDSFGRNLQRVSAQTFDHQFGVDARGAVMLIAEFARRHSARKPNWGRIIGLTSGGAHGLPGEVSYSAAKAALENYTMSAAFELAHLGITANLLHPPVTDTGWITDSVRRHVNERPDLIHIADPDAVANVITYLVSHEASLITGNIIHLR
jgi:3-oxoacyl-[acyl-carrier protein] reductase